MVRMRVMRVCVRMRVVRVRARRRMAAGETIKGLSMINVVVEFGILEMLWMNSR